MNRLIGFGKEVISGWLNAEAFTLAAALAYYAIFAIAPLLLISIHAASIFLDNPFSRRAIFAKPSTRRHAASHAKIEHRVKADISHGVPIEKYFANVVAALGLGFLLGAAVAARPAMSSRPRRKGNLALFGPFSVCYPGSSI